MLAINIVLLLQLAARVSGGEGVMLYQYWSSRASSHSDTETRGHATWGQSDQFYQN